MKKLIRYMPVLTGALLTCYTSCAYADIVWPGLIVSTAIFFSLPLIIISIIIEGLILRLFIRNISYLKSFWMSVVGNAASTLVGTLLMLIIPMVPAIFLAAIGAQAHKLVDAMLGYIPTLISMYLGSCVVELIALRLFFKYSIKQLTIPVAIGNLITYLLVLFYTLPHRFPEQAAELFSYLKSFA